MTVNLDTLHPRQRAVMEAVPAEYREAVQSRAWLLGNTVPGLIHSQAMARAWSDLQRLGLDTDALEALNRRDNHAALASCARTGCTACRRDAKR